MDPWEFGWDALVAISTGVLALMTFALAMFTARVANRTATLAEETRKLATETGEDIRAGVRPALIHEATSPQPTMRVEPHANKGRLRVDVGNAGPGPALN